MPLGTEVGPRPRPRRRCVRWRPRSPKRGRAPPSFQPMSINCLLNVWTDERATWYNGSRPRPRPHCARRDPAAPPAKEAQHLPSFRRMSIVICDHGRPYLSYCKKFLNRMICCTVTFINVFKLISCLFV